MLGLLVKNLEIIAIDGTVTKMDKNYTYPEYDKKINTVMDNSFMTRRRISQRTIEKSI